MYKAVSTPACTVYWNAGRHRLTGPTPRKHLTKRATLKVYLACYDMSSSRVREQLFNEKCKQGSELEPNLTPGRMCSRTVWDADKRNMSQLL